MSISGKTTRGWDILRGSRLFLVEQAIGTLELAFALVGGGSGAVAHLQAVAEDADKVQVVRVAGVPVEFVAMGFALRHDFHGLIAIVQPLSCIGLVSGEIPFSKHAKKTHFYFF